MKENILNINLGGILERMWCRLEQQVNLIKKGRLSVLIQEIGAALFKLCLLVPAVPAVMIIRILRPLIVIRLESLDISRIGGIYHGDWYLSGCSFREPGKRYLDIFYFRTNQGTICNYQWVKMWKRVLPVFPFWKFAELVHKISKRLPGHKWHVLPIGDVAHSTLCQQQESFKRILEHKKPHISFTKDEEALGQKALSELGIPENQPFVCFHSRDSAYLDAVYPEGSWKYHDFRDSSIKNYMSSAQELVKQGYYALRIGSIVKEKIISNNSSIIDYAVSEKRTDFLDVYLGAKCKFFICSQTGISIVPEMFRRPIVYVNWSALGQMPLFVHDGLIIPKKLYVLRDRRFLTFHEILSSGIGLVHDGAEYKKQGIELTENTPEEIASVAMEMHQRLNNIWQTADEDERLQQRFWEIFDPEELKSPNMRIGAEFLRQNQELLN